MIPPITRKETMKTGIEEIKQIILNNLYSSGYMGGIPFKKFAKDTAKIIYETILENGDDMNKLWNLAHDFPLELEPVARRIERELGVRVMRDEAAADVFRWLLEQEKNGKPLSKFFEWAKSPERVQYINQYRTPGVIQAHYPLVFAASINQYNPQNLEIGF